jgi:uncharacterized protein (TIGR03435 family)
MIPNLANNRSSAERRMRPVAVGLATAIGLVALALFSSARAGARSPQNAVAQAPVTSGAQSAPMSTLSISASFEVASIKPNHSATMNISIMFQQGRFVATGIPVKQLITMAYDVKDFQVTAGPGWVTSEKYDIEAKEPDSVVQEMDKLPPDQRRELNRSMLQSLLADRFKLKLIHETRELPAYALVVAKNGPKLHEAKPGDTYPNGIKGFDGQGHGGMMRMGPGELTGQGLPMSSLVHLLSEQLGRNVLDQTGLKGNYDFTLKWAPEPGEGMMLGGPAGGNPGAESAPPPDTSGPSIFTAIQEQMGLKLESTKGPSEVLVIDHVERPSEN